MGLSTILIADQLLLQYCLSMEDNCKYQSYLFCIQLFFIYLFMLCFVLQHVIWFPGLGSLSKWIGHMPVVRGKIHQVCSRFLFSSLELIWMILRYLSARLVNDPVFFICRSLQHFRRWSQSRGYWCYVICMLFCLFQLFVSVSSQEMVFSNYSFFEQDIWWSSRFIHL